MVTAYPFNLVFLNTVAVMVNYGMWHLTGPELGSIAVAFCSKTIVLYHTVILAKGLYMQLPENKHTNKVIIIMPIVKVTMI